MPTTYTKLRTGAWGVRSTDRISVGQTVTVIKRDGSRKQETIHTIVWTGQGITLAALAPKGAAAAPRGQRGQRTGCACGSREDEPRDSDCAGCQYDDM
jgi:hypothetical protein